MNVWIPKFKIIDTEERKVRTALTGRYKLDVVRPNGNIRQTTGWINNLITNRGLDLIGQATDWKGTCVVGTNTTTPAFTDTQLGSLLATTTTILGGSTQVNAGSPDYQAVSSWTYRFSTGAAAGNITEVGIGSSATSLFSRALIVDGVGSPTTITVLSDEMLDVTYEQQIFLPLTDAEGTVSISSSSHDYIIRAENVDGFTSQASTQWTGGRGGTAFSVYNGAIGTILTAPTGTASSSSSDTNTGTYIDGTYYRDFSSTFNTSAGNLSGGIRSLSLGVGSSGTGAARAGRFQIEFNPVINKTSSQILTLNFRHVWGRR